MAAAQHASKAQTEPIYESVTTRVSRVRAGAAARALVRKEYLGPGAAARFARETRALERLAGCGSIAQYEEAARFTNTLYLRDGGGTSLARLLADGTRFGAGRVLAFGLRLAATQALVHA